MVESLVLWEKELFLLLNSPHTPYLDGVMYLISAAMPWVVLLIHFLFLLAYKQDYKEFLLIMLFIGIMVFLADSASSGIFKPIFQRYRPTHHPETANLVKTVLGYRGGKYGFISGHSANFLAFATFTSLVIRYRWYTIIVFLTTLTVAYSRIYLGIHFITDVIPGIICGVLIGWFTYWLYSEARKSFFTLTPSQVRQPYLKPQSSKKKSFAILMAIFYFALWATAPVFITFYS